MTLGRASAKRGRALGERAGPGCKHRVRRIATCAVRFNKRAAWTIKLRRLHGGPMGRHAVQRSRVNHMHAKRWRHAAGFTHELTRRALGRTASAGGDCAQEFYVRRTVRHEGLVSAAGRMVLQWQCVVRGVTMQRGRSPVHGSAHTVAHCRQARLRILVPALAHQLHPSPAMHQSSGPPEAGLGSGLWCGGGRGASHGRVRAMERMASSLAVPQTSLEQRRGRTTAAAEASRRRARRPNGAPSSALA